MSITILLFATLKDLAGTTSVSITLPREQLTLSDVKTALSRQHPSLAAHLVSAVGAINQEFAFDKDTVYEGDNIAFFPAVSGG